MVSEKFEVRITGAHGIIIPDAIAKPFTDAGHKRVKLNASFKDNTLDFHGALHYYQDNYRISFGKRYQKQLGVTSNDYFELQMAEDTSKYGVEVPEEFAAVMESDPEAAAIFEGFTDGKKRSLIYYVIRFKSSQTRIDKSIIISENIKLGITDPRELTKDRR
jgi:hypothetical protein